MSNDYDVIIIGTGAGGGTLAHRLAPSGLRILMLERGDYLKREPDNWSSKAVFVDGKYKTSEEWYDKEGVPFHPGAHYWVGGNTKVYGAILFRLRERDFGEVRHHGGISPAWPLSYMDFEPYYTEAEKLYLVHGERGEDPTEPLASGPYPYPAVSHEPRIQRLADDFARTGHQPFHLPVGINLDEQNHEKSACVRCGWFDGYPCMVDGKADSHVCAVRPALRHDNVTLITNAHVDHIDTDPTGRSVSGVVAERDGHRETYRGKCGRRLLRGGKLCCSAFALDKRSAPRWPRELVGNGGPPLHVSHQLRDVGDLQGTQSDSVPENTRNQRLLLGLGGFRLPPRPHSNAGKDGRADVTGRGAVVRTWLRSRVHRATRDRLLAYD